MTQQLTEQLRSLVARLAEIDTYPSQLSVTGSKETVSGTAIEGSLAVTQLAKYLGINDVNLFTRAMNKVRQGRLAQLSPVERGELGMAFVKLIQAEPAQTQQALQLLKRVSGKN